MATIVPTVEIVGDETLTNSLIERTITELQDNVVTKLSKGILQGCPFLKKAVFGAVNSDKALEDTFRDCRALEVLDFHQKVVFKYTALLYCTSLKALILRGSEMSTGASFASNGITSKTGYVYVPRALVDSYKADTYWSKYASQIRAIEDWPEVCDPYSWEAVAAAISANTYKDIYKIGDMIPVDLGSEGVINMQIAAFDADTLADGSGTAAISWVAKELLKTSKLMNPTLVANGDGTYQEGTGGIGGWEKCEMRSYLNNTIKPTIPSNVLGMIKSVAKTQRTIDAAGSNENQTTFDEVWIPNNTEVYGDTCTYVELFPDKESRIKSNVGSETESSWWIRYAENTQKFGTINSSGGFSTGYSSREYGVCFGFCTGKTPT